MPTNIDNIRVVNDMLAAYNAHDPDRTASYYVEDAVIEVEGVSPPVQGRRAIADMFRARFSGEIPDIHGRVLDAVADDKHVFSWLEYDGTYKGELGAGLQGATFGTPGTHFHSRMLDRITVRDGKIADEYAVINFQAVGEKARPAESLSSVVEAAAPTAEAPVREFCAAYTAHDVDRIMAVVADDCVAVYPTLARYDKATFRDLIAEELRAFPDAAINIITVVADERNASVEFWWDATQKGEFRGQPASGQSFHLPCMLLFESRDGLLTSIRYYWNTRLWELHETT